MEVSVQSAAEVAFNPTKKQKDFLQIPFSVSEGLYGGAAGAGKTELMVWLPLIYGFHEHPLYKGITLRRSLPQLEKELIARSREIYPDVGGIYNETKKSWKFPSGAKHFFGAADKEQDIRKFDSDQYNLIQYDEATHFTEFQYSYLVNTRMRSRTSDLPAIARSGTNPGNVGHSFFKKRFVNPCINGYKIIVSAKTGLKRIFIPARITDNQHLLDANPHYIKQLEELSEAEKKAKLYGDWDVYEGQVFKEWRIEPLSDEPDNARHSVDAFDIPSWWPRFIGIDWGYAAYTCIYWAALSPDGRVYIYREYAVKETKTTDWIEDFVRLTENEKSNIRKIIICHSANQHRGEPSTILEQINSAISYHDFPVSVELGEKNRINGKMAVHEFLRWTPKESAKKFYGQFDKDLADKIFRLHGKESYYQYVTLFEDPKIENNIPRLQVFGKECPLLCETIPACVYEDTPEEGHKAEDVKEFDGDDPYDTLRNLLTGIKEYDVKSAVEMSNAIKTQAAISEMAKGDATSFYRRMEHIEAQRSQVNSNRRRSFRPTRRVRFM